MNWDQIIGLSLALILMLVGLLGSILPVLPGTPLVFAVAILHRVYFGATGASNAILITLAVLTLTSLIFDFAASALGAKKFGATWKGAVGATLGGLIGLLFSLPGIVLGPFIGAIFFEMLGGQKLKQAGKAGTGAVLGLFLGAAGKFALCVIMILLFATNVVIRSV